MDKTSVVIKKCFFSLKQIIPASHESILSKILGNELKNAK